MSHPLQPLQCIINGKTDAAIAETATFFWSLQHAKKIDPPHADYGISIDGAGNFDVGALQAEQLTRILEANPSRRFELSTGIWNAEQAWALAACSSSINMRYVWRSRLKMNVRFAFQDGGTAFVDALQTRLSSFGTLCMLGNPTKTALSRPNLIRLFQLENNVFDKLDLSSLMPFFRLRPRDLYISPSQKTPTTGQEK